MTLCSSRKHRRSARPIQANAGPTAVIEEATEGSLGSDGATQPQEGQQTRLVFLKETHYTAIHWRMHIH